VRGFTSFCLTTWSKTTSQEKAPHVANWLPGGLFCRSRSALPSDFSAGTAGLRDSRAIALLYRSVTVAA